MRARCTQETNIRQGERLQIFFVLTDIPQAPRPQSDKSAFSLIAFSPQHGEPVPVHSASGAGGESFRACRNTNTIITERMDIERECTEFHHTYALQMLQTAVTGMLEKKEAAGYAIPTTICTNQLPGRGDRNYSKEHCAARY